MERNPLHINLAEGSGDEFFDAIESLDDSSEKEFKTTNTPALKEFSPLSKMYSSSSGYKSSDFMSSSSPLVIQKQMISTLPRPWKVKDKLKKNNKEYFEFSNLTLIQEVKVPQNDNCFITFSPDGRFISISGNEPIIVLFEICRQRFEEEQFFIYDTPLETYRAHTNKITGISWSLSSLFFLSSSTDGMVYKWNLSQNTPEDIFKHNVEVVCVSTHPQSYDLFFTGAKDSRIRIWNINSTRVDCDIMIEGEICSGTFSPNGLIVVGLSQGICYVITYNCFSKSLQIVRSIDCRNKRGPKSKGRRITGIEFAADEFFLITSNDSRIRLYSAEDFEIKQKYKGLKNEKSEMFGGFGSGYVICGSEDGEVYIWNIYSKHVPKLNPIFTKKKRYKNNSFERFAIDNIKGCSFAKMAPDKFVADVQRRYNTTQGNALINNIIVVVKKGVLLVFYNKEIVKKKANNLSKSFA